MRRARHRSRGTREGPPPRRPPDPRQVAALDRGDRWEEQLLADPRARARWQRIDAPQLALVAPGARVLELGCGGGRLLGQVEARRRVGIDVAQPSLLRARAAGLNVLRADAHRLPFGAASFDVVLAGNGVFPLLDYRRAFAECARVLAAGGALALHQSAARTLSLRDLVPGAGRSARLERLHVADPEEVRFTARLMGLVPERTHLWRSVRFAPYALPWPERLWAVPLWTHATFVFRRP
jgi:SAM-dependent methyltransferase